MHQLLCVRPQHINFPPQRSKEKIPEAGRISGKDYIGQIGALQRRGTPVAVRPKLHRPRPRAARFIVAVAAEIDGKKNKERKRKRQK